MRALKLPKFSGSSVKAFLLRSSFVMWERRGKFGGRLVYLSLIQWNRCYKLTENNVWLFCNYVTHLVNRLCERFTVITF